MGTKRTPCWGLLDMRVISSANMSRLFRALLLLMSILFAALFVYQNIKSSRHPGSRVAEDRPTLSRKVLTRREKVPNYPFRTGAKDQTNRWTRVRKKTIETDNRTAGIANGRLEELKRGLDITKSKTREIVERMKGSVRLRNAFAGIENEQTTEARKLQEIGDWKKAFAGIENEQKTEARKLQDIGNGKKAFAGIENEQATEARKLQDIGDGEKVDNDSSNDDEYDDYSKSIIKDKSKQPIFIVILARMRTGSTLIGEIFNQNPSLFFIFEPLISIDPLLRSGEVDVSQHKNISTDLLLGYSRCEFQENLTHAWLKWNGGSVRSNKIIPLCKKPAGPKSRYRNCTLITVNDLRTICRQSHQRFCMKTIRADLDYFKPLVNAGINVKIIHLVRDPRGTANSRRLYYNFSRPKLPPKSFRQGNIPGRWKGKLEALGLLGNYPDHVVHTIPRLCQWTRDSILQVQNEKPSWLRNRYKLVRYEDFALDPLRMAHQIYDFVGIEYPRAVKEWIVSNTQDNDNRSVKFFSTHKNSIETASRWRQSLLPTQVRKVEAICSEMMKLLGYKKVINSMDLTNNTVILMEPLPIPDTF